MGSSMYFNRRFIPKRSRGEVVKEFTELVESLGIHVEYSNNGEMYLWKHSRPDGIRAYVDTAEGCDYPEPIGVYYREVFFDAIYDDEVCNSDLLLEITIAYMKKYPDTLLFGECSRYLYYDKHDIDIVSKQPFRRDWHYMTESHIAPLEEDIYKHKL